MSAQAPLELPFQLKPNQLAEVEIYHALNSAKVGAGKEYVTLRGDGTVRLVKSMNYKAPEEVLEGKLQRMQFIRLLEVAQEINFLGLAEDYKPEKGDPYWNRVIRLTLPGGQMHSVAVVNNAPQPEFERFAGAIRVVAALAVPEMLGKRFFPHF